MTANRRACQREACFWPDTACNFGYFDIYDCPFKHCRAEPEENDRQSLEEISLPWTGRELGLADIGFVAARTKPMVLGILGPANAGKTTLLAAWYLLLSRGDSPDSQLRFCGSRSLAGWELLAHPLRWEAGPVPPTFPPHTTSQSTRTPGLLHLAFKREQAYPTDHLVTDAPGEWFSRWAVNSEDRQANGARWITEHADAFIFIADKEALAGSQKATARTDILYLARRLGDELRDRPVALVWTKDDIEVDEETVTFVRKNLANSVPDFVEFSVKVVRDCDSNPRAEDLLAPLRWFLTSRRSYMELPHPRNFYVDPFLMFDAFQ